MLHFVGVDGHVNKVIMQHKYILQYKYKTYMWKEQKVALRKEWLIMGEYSEVREGCIGKGLYFGYSRIKMSVLLRALTYILKKTLHLAV